jgi:hypothetical protein
MPNKTIQELLAEIKQKIEAAQEENDRRYVNPATENLIEAMNGMYEILRRMNF